LFPARAGSARVLSIIPTVASNAQYTSIRYTQRLEDIGAVRSVGSKGDSYDNAAAEAVTIQPRARAPWPARKA
jgi:transposase InsO family protein